MNRNIIPISFCLLITLITAGLTAQNQEDLSMQLHNAVLSGDIEQVKSLISDGVDINANNQLNWTPLHTAVRNNRIEIIEFLLENSANVDAVDARGQTALQFAVESGQKEIVELLIEKDADINILDERQESALSLARKTGQAEIAEILIENGALEQRGNQRGNQNRGQPGGRRGMPPMPNFSGNDPEQIFQRGGPRGNVNPQNQQSDIPLPEETISIEEPQPLQMMELPNDPNEIQARIRSFEGLEEAILDISGKSRAEMRQWRNTENDNRVALTRAVQRQLEFELEFTKETAVEENAQKTTEAIDTLLSTNNDRSRIIIRELTIQIREQEREARAATTTTRRTTVRATRTRGVQNEFITGQSEPPALVEEEEETDKYDPNTQAELNLWLNADVAQFNGTISFAETINEQIREEFRSIRQIATEENAAKTMAAIDGLLLARQERFTELQEQIETARARVEGVDETTGTWGRGRMDQGTMGQDTQTGVRRRR